MKSLALIVTALLLCATVFWLYRRPAGPSVAPQSAAPTTTTPTDTGPPDHEAGSAAAQKKQEPPRPESSIRDIAPRPEVLAAEVKDNPHQTPPSLLRFAARVADRMQRARASTADASKLIDEFDDCVRDDRQVYSVQVICYVNAGRLAGFHPTLKARWQDVHEHASPDVLRLAQAMDQLGGGPG
jgi:hypothetical protein